MTSKEYIEDIVKRIEKFIEKYNDCNEHIKSQLEHYKQVLKDLEKLEEIRSTFRVEKEETINQNRYWLIGKKKPYYSYMITKEQYDKWNRWLGNEI